MNELEQTLVLSVSAVIVLTTLVIVVWQLWRGRGRD
ncbi:MAG: hypothetical protein K0S37_3353 [Microbacterium sp.]|nr:hypothetical protein [Microbacterium sp.]